MADRRGVTMLSRRSALHGLALGLAAAELPIAAWAAPTRGMIALVHTQAAGDGGVIDGMIGSLKRIGRERGTTTRAIYAADPANYQPILELLGEAGAAVVLVTFDEMAQPLAAVAPAFPSTRFIQLYADPFVPAIANVRTVEYQTYLACYLAGVCGAKISRSGNVGYIGGAAIPSMNADVNAMIAGVRSVLPAARPASAFVGSFQDPVKALEIARQMYQSGVDFIQAESSGSDAGIIDAANERGGRLVSAGSRPEFALGPQSVAAIVLCDFALSLYVQTTQALAPVWHGGHYRSGLQDGVVDFVVSPQFLAHGPREDVARLGAAWPLVSMAKGRIIAGALRVPFETRFG
jgi:basic membrane protein A